MEVALGKAVVYCRVSTERQEEEGTSLQSQADACIKHAEEQGFSVAAVVREAHSGYELWDRPKLSQLRSQMREGAYQVLVSYALDRLSRKQAHQFILLEECEQAGVSVQLVTEPLDSTAEGVLWRSMRGYMAEKEREKTRERTMRGKRQRVLNGKIHNHGSDLYGYRRDKEAGVRLLYEPEAATVRRAFQWVVDGRSLGSLARTLNDEGVPSPAAEKLTFRDGRTPRWGSGVLHRILRNPAYKGETVEWRLDGHGGKHNPTLRPEEEWVRLPEGVTPPIVTLEVWAAVQHRLDTNKGDETRNQKREYLLRGFIYCGRCGHKMYSNLERSARRVYRCYSRETPAGHCGGKRVAADAVEAWIWERVSAVLLDPALIAAERDRQQERGPDPTLTGDLEAARRMLAKIEKAQARYLRNFTEHEDDGFPWELVQREVKRLEGEKQATQATIVELEGRIAARVQGVANLDALTTYCERVARNLESFGFEDKRLALHALEIRVTAEGREYEVRGTIPLGAEEPAGVLSTSSAHCGDRSPRSPARASRAPGP